MPLNTNNINGNYMEDLDFVIDNGNNWNTSKVHSIVVFFRNIVTSYNQVSHTSIKDNNGEEQPGVSFKERNYTRAQLRNMHIASNYNSHF